MALFREEATSPPRTIMTMMIWKLEQSQADLSHPEQTVSSSDSSQCTVTAAVIKEAARKYTKILLTTTVSTLPVRMVTVRVHLLQNKSEVFLL